MLNTTHFAHLVLLVTSLCFFSCQEKEPGNSDPGAVTENANKSGGAALDAEELAVEISKKMAPINKNDEDFIRDIIKNPDNAEAIQKSREAYLKKTLGAEAYEKNKKFREALQSKNMDEIIGGAGSKSKTKKPTPEEVAKIKAENKKQLAQHKKNMEALQAKMDAAQSGDAYLKHRGRAKEVIEKICANSKKQKVCQLREKCLSNKDCKEYNIAVDNKAKMFAMLNAVEK